MYLYSLRTPLIPVPKNRQIFLLNDKAHFYSSKFKNCEAQNHFSLKSNGAREHIAFINENMFRIIMTQYAAGTVSTTLNEDQLSGNATE